MIQQFNPQNLARFFEALGNLDVLDARFNFARWVVVRHDEGGGHELDGGQECFAGMHQIGVQRAPGNLAPAQDAVSGVEEQGGEVLLGAGADALLEEVGGISRAGDGGTVRGAAFLDEFDVIKFLEWLRHRFDGLFVRLHNGCV